MTFNPAIGCTVLNILTFDILSFLLCVYIGCKEKMYT